MAVCAAMALSACVVAPPIEEEPFSDGPPVVDRNAVSPRPGTSVTLELSIDPDFSFSVSGAVTDPDGDAVFYYWYLLREEDEERVAPASALGPIFFLRPCSRYDELGLGAADAGLALRYLQLDIADRPRLSEDESGGEPRSYPERAHVVTLSWLLVLRGVCP